MAATKSKQKQINASKGKQKQAKANRSKQKLAEASESKQKQSAAPESKRTEIPNDRNLAKRTLSKITKKTLTYLKQAEAMKSKRKQ